MKTLEILNLVLFGDLCVLFLVEAEFIKSSIRFAYGSHASQALHYFLHQIFTFSRSIFAAFVLGHYRHVPKSVH